MTYSVTLHISRYVLWAQRGCVTGIRLEAEAQRRVGTGIRLEAEAQRRVGTGIKLQAKKSLSIKRGHD